jgi:hypothetical protein
VLVLRVFWHFLVQDTALARCVPDWLLVHFLNIISQLSSTIWDVGLRYRGEWPLK